jgi:TonB family protein
VAFVNAAMMLTIASLDHPVAPDLVDRVIVLLDPAFLACADDPFAPSHPRGADLAFVMPKVTREPRVQYPATLMRVAGMPDVVVTLRVRVTHTGCISSAETMRSVLPAFDLEAIQAMFGAKMTPATLGGEPVDTYVTYSVRFSLRR